MRRPVAAVGLAAEARIARAAGFDVVIGGGDPQRTRALLDAAASRANCFVSFGIAGGLAPGLPCGRVVLCGEVVSADARWAAMPALAAEIADLARAIGAVDEPVFGGSIVIATRAEKSHAHRIGGGVAVDLESAAVACAATDAGLPFVVLRAVADTADRELPAAALIPLTETGTPALRRILASVARRPAQIPDLIRLARETRIALAALVGPARALHDLALRL